MARKVIFIDLSCKDCGKYILKQKSASNPKYWKGRCFKCSRIDIVNRGVLSRENNPNWNGGTSEENKAIRVSSQYKEWAKSIKIRDDFTCQICLKKGGVLHSDHIKPFCLFPELRFDLDNGRTLCSSCHYKHGWSLFKKNNPRSPVSVIKLLGKYTPSEKTREKIRLSNLGKKRSDNAKINISKARKSYVEKNVNKLSYHIVCMNNNKVYMSTRQASETLNLNRVRVTDVVNGKHKATKGYSFQKLTAEHLIF